jgi:hypothetical protein
MLTTLAQKAGTISFQQHIAGVTHYFINAFYLRNGVYDQGHSVPKPFLAELSMNICGMGGSNLVKNATFGWNDWGFGVQRYIRTNFNRAVVG